MQYRVGTCSECGARFKVPGSFSSDKAKCQKCGGVVEIGPVQGAAGGGGAAKPAPVPARKPAAQDAPQKKRGPSMKEQLLARRQAEAAAGGAGPAQKKVGSGAKRAAASASKARSGSRKAAGAAAGAAAAGGRRAGPTGRARGQASSARRRAGADDESLVDSRAARRHRQPARKKATAGPLIGGVVLLGIAGVAAWQFFGPKDEEPVQAAGPDETVAGADSSGAPEGTAPETDQPTAPEQTDEATVDEPPAADETADADAGDDAATAAEDKPEPKGPDPSSVDLTAIEDFGPVDDTTEEEWTEIQELATTFLDPDAGADGTRAGIKLREYGKKAFPAVLNSMKTLDYSVEQGFRDGDIAQKLLQEICNGNNFGWRYTVEDADVYFNKRVVEEWAKAWSQAKEDPRKWAILAKLTAPEDPQAEEAPAVDADLDAALDDALDDLEDL